MSRYKRSMPGLILAAFLLPSLANADTGLFVGASVGSAHLEDDFSNFNIDTDATAYRFVGGFQFTDYFGIEAGYHNFGDFSETIDLGQFTSRTEIAADGWTLGGTLGLPLSDRFALYGRAGVFFWDADVEVDGFSIDVPEDENPYYGGGAKVDVTRNLVLLGDWTRYELDTINSDVISIGFQYRFGR